MNNKLFKSIMKYMLEEFHTDCNGETVINPDEARQLVQDINDDIKNGTVGLISSETYVDDEPLPVEVFIRLDNLDVIKTVDGNVVEVVMFLNEYSMCKYIEECNATKIVDDSIYNYNFKSNVHIDLKNALRRLSNDEKIIIDILTFRDGVEALDNYKNYFSPYSNVTDYEKRAIVLYYLHKHFGLN